MLPQNRRNAANTGAATSPTYQHARRSYTTVDGTRLARQYLYLAPDMWAALDDIQQKLGGIDSISVAVAYLIASHTQSAKH